MNSVLTVHVLGKQNLITYQLNIILAMDSCF